MTTKKAIRLKVMYSIIMTLLTTACLVCIIFLWPKADKSARGFLFIPIVLGYCASIFVFINRKPIEDTPTKERLEEIMNDKEYFNY